MFSQFFKGLFKAGKKAKKSIEDSVDFIDDVLEKEYITGTIDKVKEATGDVVESAGTLYQKTRNSIDDVVEHPALKDKLSKIKEKGKEWQTELSDSMSESSATLKNVMNEGKEMLDKIFDEEE